MKASHFKKLLKMRLSDSLEEYISRMEDIFGEEYWEQDFNMAAAVRGFATDLLERYEQEQEKPPEDHEEEPTEEELEDEERKGPNWRVVFEYVDSPDLGYEFKLIRAPTESHAKVLFNRWCREQSQSVNLISLRKESD